MKPWPFLLTLLFPAILHAGAKDGKLDIYWVDVEGGAATLFVTPAGESILIDTGMPGLRDPVRIDRLARRTAGLEKIDHLIITHFHIDHFGGAADLSKLIPIGQVYDYGVLPGDEKALSPQYLNFKCDRRNVLKAGDRLELRVAGSTPLSVTCLAARQQFIAPGPDHADNPLPADAKRKEVDTSANADSIVMLLRFGAFELFDGGDLTWNMEEKLVHPKNLVGEVDVMQINHHGLDASNNPVLVKSIKPKVVIMNNGDKKGNGAETFATVKSTPSVLAMYQSHKTLRPGEEANNVAPEFIANIPDGERCEGHPIQMSVAPDGKSYTVSIPANGHSATYQSQ